MSPRIISRYNQRDPRFPPVGRYAVLNFVSWRNHAPLKFLPLSFPFSLRIAATALSDAMHTTRER